MNPVALGILATEGERDVAARAAYADLVVFYATMSVVALIQWIKDIGPDFEAGLQSLSGVHLPLNVAEDVHRLVEKVKFQPNVLDTGHQQPSLEIFPDITLSVHDSIDAVFKERDQRVP